MEAAESRGVLHAELDRLPDRLRIPVVLYYLEGRSYAEAATLLGVPEATVRGRLVRARDRLRDRLTRRGFAPVEASSRLVPPTAPGIPAVPPGLVALTARAASCVTLAPAGTASSLALMQEVLGTMIASKLKAAAAGLAAILALAWMTATLAAPAAQEGPHPAANPRATVQSPPAKKLAAAAAVHYAGRVLGPDDDPIAGAEIFLHYTRPNIRNFMMSARTDAEGRFQFDVDPARFAKMENGEVALRNAWLYARAAGHGPVTIPAGFPRPEAATPPRQPLDRIEVHLPRDDVAIEGQILDKEGRPARGADIRPIALYFKQDADGKPINWSDPGASRALEQQVGKQVPLTLIAAVEADAEGRFRLSGFGRERAVVLEIFHPGSGTERVAVITRPGRTQLMVDGESPIDDRPMIRYDAAQFVHQLPGIVPRIQTVYVNVRRRGKRIDSLRISEWLSRQLSQGTKLRVIANPKEADLILEGTINEARKAPPDQPDGPRP